MVEKSEFVQRQAERGALWTEVKRIADELVAHLLDPVARAAVEAANQPGLSSSSIQAVFLEEARRLGFRDESKGLFARYQSSALRPDYFRPVGDTGILMEVERGKTTINNMDFLDFWKCHICDHASFLFLLVPRELRQNSTMRPRHEYAAVAKRLESFFRPGNYTNVIGLILIGY